MSSDKKRFLETHLLGKKNIAEKRIWENCLFNPKNKICKK